MNYPLVMRMQIDWRIWLRDYKYIKQIKDYFIQCCAYAVAHNEMFGTGIRDVVILITVDGKDPQCFETSAVPFLSDLKLRRNQYEKC